MKNKDMIRKVFQTFAIILFVFQFQQSVRKYFQYPVVEQTSRIAVKDIPDPVVYVCQANQFNYRKAKDQGYSSFTNFMTGINDYAKNITWQGYYRNQTYNELENMLLDFDYSSLESKTFLTSANLWNVNEKKNIFLFPHGDCLEIETPLQHTGIEITSKEDINIYFVDPARANNIRTEETLDAEASIGPTSNLFYSCRIYELEYLLYDDSIHDGTSCTDYTKSDMTYGECLNNILMHEFLSTYGCLPPWVSTNNSKICKDEINIKANAIRETPLYNNILQLIYNYAADIFRRCLPPCKTMQIKLQKVSYRSNCLDNAFLKVRSKEWASVHTQVNSYDILNLTVDLGSGLGLWLGLSCLSILDYLLENWILMKKYWKK